MSPNVLYPHCTSPPPNQARLKELEKDFREELLLREKLQSQIESLREQLTEAQETAAKLTSHFTELQEKWEEYLLHARDEI